MPINRVKTFICHLFLISLALAFVAPAFAQRNTAVSSGALAIPAPTANAPVTGQSYFGFDLGITGTSYLGASNFFWHINDSTGTISSYEQFDNLGSGLGFLGGLKLGFAVTPDVDVEAKARYLSNYTSKTEQHNVVLDPSSSNFNSSATNTYSLLLQNVSLAALLHYKLSEQIYALGGFEYSFLTSNTITFTQTLDPSGNGYPVFNSLTGLASPSGQYSLDQPGLHTTDYFNSSRFAFMLGAGTVFGLGSPTTLLDAELAASIPLSEWLLPAAKAHLDTVGTFYNQSTITYPKLWYVSLTVGLRFALPHSGPDNYVTPADQESASTPAPAYSNKVTPDAEGKVPLSGRVTNTKTGEPIDATMTVVDLSNNEVVASDHTDKNGYYKVRVKAPGKYSVTADADGYLFGSAYFEVDEDGRILSSHNDIKLSEATTGRTRLLVFFDFDKAELKKESIPELNRAVHLMKAVPSMQVEIAGYTDSKGTVEYNKDLSLRRAMAVKTYLVDHGVAKNRVAATGYGPDSPIADNATDAGRAENRRVEFVVTSK